MKRTLLLAAVLVTAGLMSPVAAQGTYSNEGKIVEKMKAAVAAYESADWAAYKSAFADTVTSYNNAEQLTLAQ